MKKNDNYIIQNNYDFHISDKKKDLLISTIQLAAKIIYRDIKNNNILQSLNINKYNIHNELQTSIDIHSNQIFKSVFKNYKEIAAFLSEEEKDYFIFNEEQAKNGNFIILLDPLDGSSNIDSNITVGSIFSVYKRVTKKGNFITNIDFLQPGNKQILAGYIIYSHSLILVYTFGDGVYSYTYEPTLGIFYLTHTKIMFPNSRYTYSINEGHWNKFPFGIKEYIKYCQKFDLPTKRPYTSRYTGTLVADFHRNLLCGGIYIYPNTTDFPQGKLRLLYECNPLSFIAEQAGGKASNGISRILNINPISLHQKTPLFIGNQSLVIEAEKFYNIY
uniref:Fructose-1,6-bisphosphatase class 1 n=1 Tax=Candidatus Aschnera chinzeii TaxID=1485666 RepID=A0AAT9G487_9ENTR|nr:MAG: class 1 fructose-bisphosphatase [Candidatus Aschnera chinzeii]